MGSQAVQPEQRSMRRFTMQLPVQVKLAGLDTIATTRDVSAKGVFIYTDRDFANDSPIEFTLTLPPEITMTQSIRVNCTGKVVRVERDPRGKYGVAALIDHYRFLDSSEPSS
ncbi:MAG TPA: PilZ domain-containing protein [Terriglobales bacterium]|nr:PilZ domain-containing protein [Terriglobales bacterium]